MSSPLLKKLVGAVGIAHRTQTGFKDSLIDLEVYASELEAENTLLKLEVDHLKEIVSMYRSKP